MSKRIKSFVRIRPYIKSQDGANNVYEFPIDEKKNSINLDSTDYSFDSIFGQNFNNHMIYENSLKAYIKDALNGINTTVFAYGQTCSGKTHTIFGHKNNEKGIIYRAIEDIFKQNEFGTTKVKASISFYEIYNEQINDLLGEKDDIPIKEVNGSFVLTSIAEQIVESAEEAIDLLRFGNDNKAMGCSYLHEKSSRSHCIFRIHLAIQNKGLCELNFVDLAGSELLTDTYGSQQQKETKNINMSLFNLKNVIFSLSENASFIPYRNSALTKLLQNSLGGNSQTAIFCMISPLETHLQHSKRTLSFGQTAGKIINNLLVEKSIFKKESDVVKEHVKINEQKISFNKPVDSEIDSDLHNEMKVLNGSTQIYTYGNPNSKNLAIYLPAYGSCGKKCMAYSYNSLVERNFFVVSLDYPGQNLSSGQKLNVRGHDQSVPFLDKLIKEEFGMYEHIILLGYDYGAALGMNYGIKNNPKVKQIFSFHPAWSQDMAILKDLKQKVVLLWVTAEQLHPLAQGEKMNKIIPKCKLIKLNCGKFNSEKPKKAYKCIGDQVTKQIIDNLDPLFSKNMVSQITDKPGNQEIAMMEEVEEEKKQNEQDQSNPSQNKEELVYDLDELLSNKEQYLYYKKNLRGACLRKEFNKERQEPIEYAFLQEPQANSSPQEMQRWAIGRFKELLLSGELKEFYKGYLNSTPLRTQAIKLFGNLPSLIPYEKDLNKFKMIWGEDNLPQNLNKINEFPCYLKGRQVQVKTKVNPFPFDKSYLEYDKNGDECITHKAYIESYDQPKNEFIVKVNPDKVIRVSDYEIYRLNNPTNFSGNPLQEGLLFEDGIKCKYGDLLTKAKLMEAALSISDLVGKIDYGLNFDQDNANNQFLVNTQNLEIQKKCVERISKCIDLIHLVQEGIHPSRYIAFECGKLAYFGQGNCHTLASVVCAFLLPFSHLLGLEVKFRAGSLLKYGREIDEKNQKLEKWDGKFNSKVEDHTWVEVTYQPSQQTVVFDKSDYINNMPINQAYSKHMHISDRTQCNSKQPKSPATITNPQLILSNQGEDTTLINPDTPPYGDKSVFPAFNWADILGKGSSK